LGGPNVILTRDIETRSGFAELGTNALNSVFQVAGTVSGPGGVKTTGSGYVHLTAANTYTGPTVVQGGLAINSDASLGNGGTLELRAEGSGLKLLGPWTTNRPIILAASSSISTNGFDATLLGPVTNPPNAINLGLSKSGAGTLTIPIAQEYNGYLAVDSGTIRLSNTGTVASASIALRGDGSFVLDNSTVVLNRLLDNASVTFQPAGEFRLMGNSSSAVVERVGRLSINGSSTITLTAPGSTSTVLHFSDLDAINVRGLFRGDALGGGPSGAFTRIVFDTPPSVIGGVVPGVLADTTSTGNGSGFAVYDTSSDAAGVIGIRPLRANEYVASTEIRNPANGGATPTDAHILAAGSVTTGGAKNTIGSLTFEGSPTLALGVDQRRRINTAGILTRAGGNASISGGGLEFGFERGYLPTYGN